MSLRTLVVDDEPVAREILREHFHALGLHFECVLLYSEIRVQIEWHGASSVKTLTCGKQQQ